MNHCRQWSDILDSGAKFWQWARLCVDHEKFPDQSWRLLNSRVIKLVPEIHFQGPETAMPWAIINGIWDSTFTNLRLLKLVGKWELPTGQMPAVISKICQAPDLRLNGLILHNMNISLVPPEDLVEAIQRLEMVQFLDGWMTDEQATAILTMAKESRLGRIKSIKLLRVGGIDSVFTSLLHESKLNNKLEVERDPMEWAWEY